MLNQEIQNEILKEFGKLTCDNEDCYIDKQENIDFLLRTIDLAITKTKEEMRCRCCGKNTAEICLECEDCNFGLYGGGENCSLK